MRPASSSAGETGVQANEGPSPVFSYAFYGNDVGMAGIATASVGGRAEIYLSAHGADFISGSYWYAVAFDPALDDYEMTYVSPSCPFLSRIVRLDVADVRAEPGPEIVLLLEDGRVEVRSAETKQLLARFATSLQVINGGALRFFDVDGDGLPEILGREPGAGARPPRHGRPRLQ